MNEKVETPNEIKPQEQGPNLENEQRKLAPEFFTPPGPGIETGAPSEPAVLPENTPVNVEAAPESLNQVSVQESEAIRHQKIEESGMKSDDYTEPGVAKKALNDILGNLDIKE